MDGGNGLFIQKKKSEAKSNISLSLSFRTEDLPKKKKTNREKDTIKEFCQLVGEDLDWKEKKGKWQSLVWGLVLTAGLEKKKKTIP